MWIASIKHQNTNLTLNNKELLPIVFSRYMHGIFFLILSFIFYIFKVYLWSPTFTSVMKDCMFGKVWVCYLISIHVLASFILVNGKDGMDLFSSTANMKQLFAREENIRGKRHINLLTRAFYNVFDKTLHTT